MYVPIPSNLHVPQTLRTMQTLETLITHKLIFFSYYLPAGLGNTARTAAVHAPRRRPRTPSPSTHPVAVGELLVVEAILLLDVWDGMY